jgi:hypothetical protein
VAANSGPKHRAKGRCEQNRSKAPHRRKVAYSGLGEGQARASRGVPAQDARLPTIFGAREYVDAGGLLSYGPNWTDLFRRAAEQVDKMLRGAKPTDIPVEQPTKFDLIINLKTAKALGLTVPPSVLARRRGDRVGSRRLPVMAWRYRVRPARERAHH